MTSINRSIFFIAYLKENSDTNTQWLQAKLDKLVTSLSQLPINYY